MPLTIQVFNVLLISTLAYCHSAQALSNKNEPGEKKCSSMLVGGGDWHIGNNKQGSTAFLSKSLLRQFAKENSLKIVYGGKIPFARQLNQLETGGLDLLVGIYPTGERLEKYSFSKAYFYDDLYVYAPPKLLRDIKVINDLKKYVGVVVRGASYGEKIDQFHRLYPGQQYLVRQQSQRVAMVELARVDYFISTQNSSGFQNKKSTVIKQASQPICISEEGLQCQKKARV
jgi:ABC-type amino acid transport substrate-binding protein